VAGVNISAASANEGAFDENDRVSMRGTSPSFTQTTIDGHGVASGDWFVLNQSGTVGRSVSYSLLPSELVSQIVVHKSSEASLVEGGLAGTVNLRPARPFDYDDLAVSYKLEGAYQSSSEEVDPRATLLISKTWNDTFGILVNVAASKRTFRTDGWSSQGWTSGRVGPQVANPMGGATITQVTQNPDAGYGAGLDWNLPSLLPNNATTRANGFVRCASS